MRVAHVGVHIEMRVDFVMCIPVERRGLHIVRQAGIATVIVAVRRAEFMEAIAIRIGDLASAGAAHHAGSGGVARAIERRFAGIVRDLRIGGPGAVALHDRAGGHILPEERDVALAVVEIEAFQSGKLASAAIALIGDAAAHRNGGGIDIVLQLDVDDAGDGVCAIEFGAAVFEDFDAGNLLNRDRVHVDTRCAGVLRGAFAVDQHQNAVAAEVAQIGTGGTEEAVGLGIRSAGVTDRRQALEIIAQRAGGRLLNLLRRDDLNRIGVRIIRRPQERTCHDDIFTATIGAAARIACAFTRGGSLIDGRCISACNGLCPCGGRKRKCSANCGKGQKRQLFTASVHQRMLRETEVNA